ncbi:hypothetical protein R3W88_014426 [Solanum pinnatisectum]|uniref:Uncharacterized protein n=1 Tax=Solanum pinnatisectum TaxID=50273 RepID=A0AAV9KSD0_9SOLN|nr:hypothetical protein R3W88_014426 [Solanum pinnatisectum]
MIQICYHICSEYTEQLCSSKVKQLLCLGPSNKYYLVEGDSGIRTLQNVLSTQSNVLQLQLFVVEEGKDYVPALDISQLNEPFPITRCRMAIVTKTNRMNLSLL